MDVDKRSYLFPADFVRRKCTLELAINLDVIVIFDLILFLPLYLAYFLFLCCHSDKQNIS